MFLLPYSHKMNTTFGLQYETVIVVSASLNIIVVLPLNVYVMWLILTGARLASNLFNLNLAMSDVVFSLSTIWFFVYVGVNCLFCFDVFMFFRGLFFTARPLFQCCICVECYVGVVHPVLFLRLKALRYRVACCCVAWLINLVSCIYAVYNYMEYLYLYYFFILSLLLFSVKLFCCLSVLWTLKRPGPGEKNPEKKSNTMKRRAFKIILMTMISMAVNFFLYVAAIPLQCCLKSFDFFNALTICLALALLAGLIQPLIYLRRAGKVPCFWEL